MQQKTNIFSWNSEVRGYELDMQGIVNNANYLHYFDHARVKYLLFKGIDWSDWHQRGYDLVLVHVNMSLKASLGAHDKFYVTSVVEKLGRLKFLFKQKIFLKSDDSLIAEAENTVVCLSSKNSRPVFPDELNDLLFNARIKNT